MNIISNKYLKTFILASLVGILAGIQGMAGSVYILFGLLALNIVDSQQEAAGTTLLYTSIPLTLGATYIYYKQNKVNLKIASILIPTALVFSVIGAKLNFILPPKFVFFSIAIFTFGISIYFFKKFISS
jgi:uncharacterized membrane protein YfcA